MNETAALDIVIPSLRTLDEPNWELTFCLATIRRFTDITYRLILEQGPGSASANRNLGLRKSTAPVVCFMDDDVWVTPGWCSRLLDCFKDDKTIGMVAPKIKLETGRLFSVGMAYVPPHHIYPIDFLALDTGIHNKISHPFAIPTTCLMVRREAIDQAGLFDEGFKSSQWEDIDYYLRLREVGFRGVLNGEVTLYHRNLYRTSHELQNQIRFMDKWRSKMSDLT